MLDFPTNLRTEMTVYLTQSVEKEHSIVYMNSHCAYIVLNMSRISKITYHTKQKKSLGTTYVPAYLSIFASPYVSTYPSTYQPTYLRIYPSYDLPTCLRVCSKHI